MKFNQMSKARENVVLCLTSGTDENGKRKVKFESVVRAQVNHNFQVTSDAKGNKVKSTIQLVIFKDIGKVDGCEGYATVSGERHDILSISRVCQNNRFQFVSVMLK